MAINEGSKDYYTGDLEKRFNYFWQLETPIADSITDNPWREFVRLVDIYPHTPAIRTHFTSAGGKHPMMSRGAYYRWIRSLHAKRKSAVT